MINSLFISLTGMAAYSSQIGTTSNNIANMETTAFKASDMSFADMLSASINRSAGDNAGTGVTVQSVSECWTQGDIATASSDTALAINGDGTFIVRDSSTGAVYYTRDGNFEFDREGNLVYDDEFVVQGYALDEEGNLGSLGDIAISTQNAAPNPTTTISATVNLDSGAESGDTFETTIGVYDSLGNEIPVTFTYTKSATSGEWDWTAEISTEYGAISSGASGTLVFDENGNLEPGADPVLTLTLTNGAAAQTIEWDIFDESGESNGGFTQFAGDSVMTDSDQDGYSSGEMVSVEIDSEGMVVCTYSNGVTLTPYRIALADFTNYNGLEKIDGNLYKSTRSSGSGTVGVAGSGQFGEICANSRELSNVDLSTEVATLITSQTAYEACAKAFSVTDEMLQVLLGLKS